MGGLFGNLVQASKALMAHQVAIQVTGRNMANVNNPEYARQRVKLGDRYVEQTSHGPAGSGVEVLQVQAMRDQFLDAQVVRQASDFSSLDTQRSILSNLELVLGDKIDSNASTTPTTTGVGAALNDFFNAFSALAANPADIPTRAAALSAAQSLADRLNMADQRVLAAQDDQEQQIQSDVQKANILLADIARLNQQIHEAPDAENGGAVDLVDRRQAKLEELAALVKVDVAQDLKNPSELNLSISGVSLVSQGQLVHQLGYLTQSAAAQLATDPNQKVPRFQGFEVGDYDQSGKFIPATSSNGGAALLLKGDSVTASGVLDPLTVVLGKANDYDVVLSTKALVTGPVNLTVNGVPNARLGWATKDSNVVNFAPAQTYQVVPTGGSIQGRFQAVFGAPTASYMSAKGVHNQLATLATTLKAAVNGIYNAAGTAGADFFQSPDAISSTYTTTVGSPVVKVSGIAGFAVGMKVTGTGIPLGATVASLVDNGNGTGTVVLNVPASATVTTTAPRPSISASQNLLDVNSNITAESMLTAANKSDGSRADAGNNDFAAKITALRDANIQWTSVISGASRFQAKITDFTRGIVTSLAQTISSVSSRGDESSLINTALKAQRDGVSGVSLDEETADLMRFQKAYQANAKVISVIDDMLSSVIAMVR